MENETKNAVKNETTKETNNPQKTSTANRPSSSSEKAKEYGKKFLHFFKRTDYNTNQNLRFASVCLAIVFLIGMFQPLAGITFGVDLVAGGEGKQEKVIPIVPTNSSFCDLNVGDMVINKQLKDYELFGTELDEFEIFGVNLYDFITSSFPDFSGLENVNNALDAEWIQFFKSDQFAKICDNFLGEYADGIVGLAGTIVDLSQKTGDVLDKVTEVLNTMSQTKAKVIEGVHKAESLINTMNLIVFCIVDLFIIGVVLLCFKKLPRYLAPAVMTPVCLIFIAIGVGIIVANGMISSIIDPVDQSFNQVLKDFVATSLPDVAKLIDGFVKSAEVNFVLTFRIVAGVGWWIMTLCVTGCTVMGYVVGKRNKGLSKELRN